MIKNRKRAAYLALGLASLVAVGAGILYRVSPAAAPIRPFVLPLCLLILTVAAWVGSRRS